MIKLSQLEYFISVPLGLATIIAVLHAEGHDIHVIDFDALRDRDEQQTLRTYGKTPDIVLITAMITNYTRIVRLVNSIKSVWPDTTVIIGGSLPATAPKKVLENIKADIFVVGEGDEVIKDCINAFTHGDSFEDIAGIIIRRNSSLIATPPARIPDISRTPRPLYEAFDMTQYLSFLNKTGRGFELYASKGCPFSCAYCYRIAGNNVRYRRVENVISEIEFIRKRYGINRFSFEDDCFALNKKWLVAFCEKAEKIKINFRFQASVNNLEIELLDIMVKAGLYGVSMGIESASPDILKELNKKINLQKAERLIAWLRKNNIQYNATFILGSPGEDAASVALTKNFLIKNGFTNNFQLFYLTPYPGTRMYEQAVARGLIRDELQYIEELKLLDEITINLTRHSDAVLKNWREEIIREVATSSGYSGVHWKLNQ